MNNRIKEQLNKVMSTKIDFDDDTTKIVIPKTTKFNNNLLKRDTIYLIEISDSVLYPDINSTLASNWNGGKIPKYKYYKAEVVDTMNNMVKFNGIAYDDGRDLYSESWFGWLPSDLFKVVRIIDD